MKIVVTGAQGFLGRAVGRALEGSQAEVIGLGRRDGNLQDLNSTLKLLSGADVVVHLAATVGGVEYLKNNKAVAYYENMSMGYNVVAACLKNNIQRLVMIGTGCSYPPQSPMPLVEEDIYKDLPSGDTGSYGLAKATITHMANQLLLSSGKEVVTLIPTNLYGPGDNFDPIRSHVVAALLRKAFVACRRGDTGIEVWGDGTATRDLLHIDDAARAIAQAALAPTKFQGEILNLASGIETTIRELAETVVSAVKPAMKLTFDATKPSGTQRRVMSIDKAEQLLGFSPSISLSAGIRETVDWVNRLELWNDWMSDSTRRAA